MTALADIAALVLGVALWTLAAIGTLALAGGIILLVSLRCAIKGRRR